MPDLDDSAASASRTGENETTPPSRRSVLRGAAGVGAAGIAATTLAGIVAPASAAVSSRPAKTPAGEHDTGDDAIVVHVRDAASGEIDIFRGTSQTRMHDRALVAHLIRASK